MRFAEIADGLVVNLVAATEEVAAERGWVAVAANVGLGWRYDGSLFSPPPRDLAGEWQAVRAQRDRLLAESDSRALADRWAAMADQQRLAWQSYRQALRDLPTAFADPAEVVYPQRPE